MKKEYMKPTMKVVGIKRCTLLTTSSLQLYRGGGDPEIENDDDFL
jgi:hypothetical protein